MVASKAATMGDRRALLTDREREIVAGEADVSDSYRYQTISRVRARYDRLEGDLQALRKHGDLLEELQDVVCEDVRDPAVSPEEPVRDEVDASPQPEPRESDPAAVSDETGFEEPPADGPDLPAETEISDDVWSVVNEASASWDDEPERLETRRKAAATVLQYALTHDVHVGKSSDVVEAARERYPVEGQNAETWWRKNVRDDVLKVVGTYSKGHHGYAVENLEVDDE